MGSFSYHVGQRIKKYRKSRGYTIEQFSAMINKSKATLSKYENGSITIDIETLYDIAKALDVDLKCFVDYQPPVFRSEPVLPQNFYFSQPRAYMYYYDGRVRQLVRSLLCFSPSASGNAIDVMLYLGVESFQHPDRCLFSQKGWAQASFLPAKRANSRERRFPRPMSSNTAPTPSRCIWVQSVRTMWFLSTMTFLQPEALWLRPAALWARCRRKRFTATCSST